MKAVARSVGDRHRGQFGAVLAQQRGKRGHAIGSTRVPVRVEDDESAFGEIDAPQCARPSVPERGDLRGAGGAPGTPLDERPLVGIGTDGEHGEAGCGTAQGHGAVVIRSQDHAAPRVLA
jgi:hypothetical protein